MKIETFAPFEETEDSCTAWAPCRQALEQGLAFCQAIVAIRRNLQPTGGLDGGALNRLAVQAITGLSPEQLDGQF